MKDFWKQIGVVAAIVIAMVCVALFCGCSSTGVNVKATSASGVNVMNISLDTKTIPMFSMLSGPSVSVWVNKDYFDIARVEGGGTVTNDVSALGIYESAEKKTANLAVDFYDRASTNSLGGAAKP